MGSAPGTETVIQITSYMLLCGCRWDCSLKLLVVIAWAYIMPTLSKKRKWFGARSIKELSPLCWMGKREKISRSIYPFLKLSYRQHPVFPLGFLGSLWQESHQFYIHLKIDASVLFSTPFSFSSTTFLLWSISRDRSQQYLLLFGL